MSLDYETAEERFGYARGDAPPFTPRQFIRLGRLVQALSDPVAGEVIDAWADDGTADFSAADGRTIDMTGASWDGDASGYEFTPGDDDVSLPPGVSYETARSAALEFAYMMAENGDADGAMDTAIEIGAGTEDLAELETVVGSSYAREQIRQIEDDQAASELRLLGPRRSEERLARAEQRIAAGTYVPAGQYAARGGGDDTLCGPDDGFSRCAATFHASWCMHNTEAGASTGSFDDAEAWRQALNRHSSPDRRAAVGLEFPRTERTTSVHGLAEQLGLTDAPSEPVSARTAAGARRQAEAALRGFR